jgi:phage/plasmid-like protein (TIGR03299 family)
MPSGITKTDGLAFVERTPWHGLGVRVEGGAMTAAQAMSAAGLDWNVNKEPLFHLSADGQYREIENRKAIVREDTGTVFATLSNLYEILQNLSSFAFFDSVIGTGEAAYHTAGSLFGGKRIWLLAKLNGDYTLDNGETLESYVLLDNSHDGSTAVRMRLTPVRVVCSNTLAAATARDAEFSARHTRSVAAKVGEARDLLGLNAAYMSRFLDQCNRIAAQAWDSDRMVYLAKDLLGLDENREMADQKGALGRAGETMVGLFAGGTGNAGKTRWDAYNAVTEYLDYVKGGRSIDSVGATDDHAVAQRFESGRYGDGRRMRERAWSILQT